MQMNRSLYLYLFLTHALWLYFFLVVLSCPDVLVFVLSYYIILFSHRSLFVFLMRDRKQGNQGGWGGGGAGRSRGKEQCDQDILYKKNKI